MTRENKNFWKIIYLLAILVLMVSVWVLGRPVSVGSNLDEDGRQNAKGGILGMKLHDQKVSDASLGKIDPASSAMKLGTFGMRGVAIAVLWHNSQEYEKRKDWNNVIATSNQIMRLEPHFTTIWEFLGWKLAYNASAEFDDYRERYRWVIRGFDFLVDGIEVNENSAMLNYKAGWTISQKIGIADEKVQYRKLLREDEAFNERYQTMDDEERDNWLLGIRWYKRAEYIYDNIDKYSLGKQSPPLIFSYSRMNRIHYANWLATDGIFDDDARKIRDSWKIAGEQWLDYGNIKFDTTIKRKDNPEKTYIATLREAIDNKEEESQLISELKRLQPGLFEELVLQKWNTTLAEGQGRQCVLVDFIEKAIVPDDGKPETEFAIIKQHLDKTDPGWNKRFSDERDAILHKEIGEERLSLLKVPFFFLNEQDQKVISEAKASVAEIAARSAMQLKVTPAELADSIKNDKRLRGLDIIQRINQLAEQTRMSDLYRGIMNYPHWERSIEVEQVNETIKAREYVFHARKAYAQGDHGEANRLWLLGTEQWSALLRKSDYEDLADDSAFVRDILDYAVRYVIILDQLDSIFPENFPLASLIYKEVHDNPDYQATLEGFEYAKKEFDEGKFDDAKTHLSTVLGRMQGVLYADEYMRLAPVPEIRDDILRAAALYAETLRKSGETKISDMPLMDFLELMLKNDPQMNSLTDELYDLNLKIDQAFLKSPANTDISDAEKEQLEALKTTVEATFPKWKTILEKYPFLYFEIGQTMNPSRSYAIDAAKNYKNLMDRLKQPVPEDFVLKSFL